MFDVQNYWLSENLKYVNMQDSLYHTRVKEYFHNNKLLAYAVIYDQTCDIFYCTIGIEVESLLRREKPIAAELSGVGFS